MPDAARPTPSRATRPLRVVIASVGTAGDIHPYIAVALKLTRRGHQVLFLANPFFKERILGAHIGFWPVGNEDEYRAMVTDTGLVTPRSSAKWVFDNLIMASFQPLADQLGEAVRVFQPDLLFAHHIALGALGKAEALGLPRAQGVLAPLFWLSRHEALAMPTWPMPDAPALVRRAQARLLRGLGRLVVDPPLNRARKSLDLPKIRNFASRGARGGDGLLASERLTRTSDGVPTLGLWSRAFRPPMPDDPRPGVICGFCSWDRPVRDERGAADIAALRSWMGDGEPPVLVTLGSSVSHHGESLYRDCARACVQMGRRVVLLTDARVPEWADLPGARTVPYAPYAQVMPRAAAIVHHAGIGTTAAALRAGVPSLIVPFANDEFDNAVRARRLGVARVLARRRVSALSIRRELETLLADRATLQSASALAQELGAENGPASAADELQKLV